MSMTEDGRAYGGSMEVAVGSSSGLTSGIESSDVLDEGLVSDVSGQPEPSAVSIRD